jgi:hypothetical protein
MKNLWLIFVGTFVALCFAAQPVAAATDDIALKLTASAYRVHSNGTLNITATATNKGPDAAGEIFINPQAQSGLSISAGATCIFPGGSVSGDGPFCEFDTPTAPGQSVTSTLTFTASPTSQPLDAWFVSCANTGDLPESNDPIARNDCAVIVIRVLP